MALVGIKVPPCATAVFLPSRAERWEERGSQPTHGTFPRLPGASPDRCALWANHRPCPLPIPASCKTEHPCAGQWGLARTLGQLRRRGRRCWDMATSPTPSSVAREVPIRGAPAQEVFCCQNCAPYLVWPCNSLWHYVSEECYLNVLQTLSLWCTP